MYPKTRYIILFLMLVCVSSFLQFSLGLQGSKSISSFGEITYPPQIVGEVLTAHQDGDALSEVTEEAKRYDLISYRGRYQYVKDAKQANPNLVAIVYYNVPVVRTDSWLEDEETGKTSYQVAKENGWLLYDENGQEIRFGDNNVHVLADIGNKGYQNWLADWVKYKMDKYGVDGMMGDNYHVYYVSKHDPINPRTGKIYTYEEWANALVEMAKVIKSRGAILIGNGGAGNFGSGENGYWGKFRVLYDKVFSALDGVLIEGIIRWADRPLRSESDWVKDLDHFKHLTTIAPNKIVVAWAVCYGIPSESGLTEEQLAWYSFAMYLLGRSSSKSYFCARGVMDTWDGWQIDVGEPLQEYHKRSDSSIYERRYSKALVLANPTESSFTITLDKSYKLTSGTTVGPNFTIKPHTGVVLFVT